MMETSLSRFGMILDSVQSDIMQVNKGTKELVLEGTYSIFVDKVLEQRAVKIQLKHYAFDINICEISKAHACNTCQLRQF